ncbi:MAG: Crp/Fnr family transcriptional regulator [Burkholderiales bacterium]
MVSITQSLLAVPLFNGLSPEGIAALAASTIVRKLAKSTIVVTEGERSDSLYVILSGRVKVFVSDEDGRDLVLNVRGPGQYFGELALDEGPRSASVATLEPCQLAVISYEAIKSFITHHPDAAMQLIRVLIGHARHMTAMFKDLAMLDVYGRVAKFLLDNAREVDGKLVIEERLTQQDIGERVSASREMVSRILKELTSGGYISSEAGRIVVHRKPPHGW